MLDERKVKLMTRMASYEQNEGNVDFKVSAYYRKDYVSIRTVCSILWATVGYICIVGLFVLTGFDVLLSKLSMGMMVLLAVVIFIGYFVVTAVYVAASRKIYDKKHRGARSRVKRYNHDLTRLLRMYEKENQ